MRGTQRNENRVPIGECPLPSAHLSSSLRASALDECTGRPLDPRPLDLLSITPWRSGEGEEGGHAAGAAFFEPVAVVMIVRRGGAGAAVVDFGDAGGLALEEDRGGATS